MSIRDEFAAKLSRMSDRICSRILHEDVEWIDIQIEIERMRDLALAEFPERADFFDRIFESRFRRLWEQWHEDAHQRTEWFCSEW